MEKQFHKTCHSLMQLINDFEKIMARSPGGKMSLAQGNLI